MNIGGGLHTETILHFLESVDVHPSAQDLIAAYEGLLEANNIHYYTLLRIPVAKETSVFRMLHGHLPDDWPDLYISRGYHLIDPVLRHLVAAQGAYRYDEANRAFEKDAHRRGIERLAVDRSRFGIEDGYTFPVYGRLGLAGAATLSGDRQDVSRTDLYLLSTAVNRVFWRFMNLSDDDFARLPPTEQAVGMTRREKEVLALLAEGLTSNEIARELNISNHTVDWYVNGLQDKLEARNRQHAVSLAFRRGLLV